MTVRSYSRNSGETSCDTDTSNPAAPSSSATAFSCEGSRSACSRHTATASTPSGISGAAPTGSISRPAASRRPATSRRRSRGTRGSGRSAQMSYSDGRSWRAISITSAKPAVVTRATVAPRRSSRALVATVVPWASSSGWLPSRPSRTARPGSSGVDSTLAIEPSAITTSVNVPPVSTPQRTQATLWRRGHRRHPRRRRALVPRAGHPALHRRLQRHPRRLHPGAADAHPRPRARARWAP